VGAAAPPEVLRPELHAGSDSQGEQHAGAELGTTNIVATGAGHSMMLYQPKFMADNIIAVVDRVRQAS
jgi:hypothetical protein